MPRCSIDPLALPGLESVERFQSAADLRQALRWARELGLAAASADSRSPWTSSAGSIYRRVARRDRRRSGRVAVRGQPRSRGRDGRAAVSIHSRLAADCRFQLVVGVARAVTRRPAAGFHRVERARRLQLWFRRSIRWRHGGSSPAPVRASCSGRATAARSASLRSSRIPTRVDRPSHQHSLERRQRPDRPGRRLDSRGEILA